MVADPKRSGVEFDRRSFLKAVGSTVAIGGTGVAAADDDTILIPTAITADEVLKWERVPKEWWHHIKMVRDAKADLHDRISDHPGIVGASVTSSDRVVGGMQVTKIRVAVDGTYQGPLPEIPDEFDGIEVLTSVVDQDTPMGCTNRTSFDDMPGGVITEATGSV